MTAAELRTHTLELMQLALLLIVFTALYILRNGEHRLSRPFRLAGPARRLRQPFAWFFLLSIAILVSTRGMLVSHDVQLGGVVLPSFSASLTFPAMFALDLLGAAFLVARTGGYSQSPFSPMLLIIPLLAILLRESPLNFCGYAVAAALLMSLLARMPRAELEVNPLHGQASALVTWGCLALAALMGYVSRPTF